MNIMETMAKKTRVVSVRGMNPDMKEAMDSLIVGTGVHASDAYASAIDALCDAIESGDHVSEWPRSFHVKMYRVKLPKSVVDRADAAIMECSKPARKSSFVREAVRRYLRAVSSEPDLVEPLLPPTAQDEDMA